MKEEEKRMKEEEKKNKNDAEKKKEVVEDAYAEVDMSKKSKKVGQWLYSLKLRRRCEFIAFKLFGFHPTALIHEGPC